MDSYSATEMRLVFGPGVFALTWLAGYNPSTFDATLDATEPCSDDDTPDLASAPAAWPA